MIAWALVAVAAIAIALLAWKLLQPTPGSAPSAVEGGAAPADNDGSEMSGAPDSGPTEAFTLAAVIDDPDGFTNIRSGGSTKAAIVGKILDGETFLTYQQPGPWWRVRKADGTSGFMFRKYIRLIEGGATAKPPASTDGPMPTGVGGSGVVLPDSSDRLLSVDELGNYSALELRIARNEIFARHGLRFKDPRLRTHFSQFDWYSPTTDTVSLTPTEKANVALLKTAEDAVR